MRSDGIQSSDEAMSVRYGEGNKSGVVWMWGAIACLGEHVPYPHATITSGELLVKCSRLCLKACTL